MKSAAQATAAGGFRERCRRIGRLIVKDFKRNKYKYLIVLPVLVYLAIFAYKPMSGVQIAFKQFKPTKGIMGSPWVGLDHFRRFFGDFYFGRILRNTVLISLESILFGFPVPILFALFLNEVRSTRYKKAIQTASYLPHFISTVIICAMIREFTYNDGLINDIIAFFGGERVTFLQFPRYFRPVYIISDIWQGFGWSSIIYLAALTSVDQEMYEAARIDGAGRLRHAVSITIPSILPTIVMLFILRMGSVLSVGSEKILLLYNERTYETADVISTYTYRQGLINNDFSYSTAIGLFNSVINMAFLLTTNAISKRVADIGLF